MLQACSLFLSAQRKEMPPVIAMAWKSLQQLSAPGLTWGLVGQWLVYGPMGVNASQLVLDQPPGWCNLHQCWGRESRT